MLQRNIPPPFLGSNKPSKNPAWKQAASCNLLSCWYLAWLIQTLRWRWHVPLKRRLNFYELHNIISQKTVVTLHNHYCENLKSYKIVCVEKRENHEIGKHYSIYQSHASDTSFYTASQQKTSLQPSCWSTGKEWRSAHKWTICCSLIFCTLYILWTG
jgi:hypothetical protein